MKTLRSTLGNANALVVFESAARLGSFTRAAEELGMTQPAVTRHIRLVEQAAGKALFSRTHNRVALTAEGERLRISIADGFGSVAGVLDGIRAGARRREISIASTPGFAQHWLMPSFDALCDVLDAYDVRLMISDTDEEIDAAAVDFSIRMGTGAWPGKASRRLIDEIVVPVASPAFLDRHPIYRNCPPERLLDAPLLHMDAGGQPWMTWAGWFRALGLAAKGEAPKVRFESYPLVTHQTLAGRGIALGWHPLVDAMLADGLLIPVGPTVRNPALGYYLVWDERSPEPAGLVSRWFAERIG